MKSIGKYLEIEEISDLYPNKKTRTFNVYNKGAVQLGWISWYGPWRQYCFSALPNTIFNTRCLTDIAAFLQETTTAYRNE